MGGKFSSFVCETRVWTGALPTPPNGLLLLFVSNHTAYHLRHRLQKEVCQVIWLYSVLLPNNENVRFEVYSELSFQFSQSSHSRPLEHQYANPLYTVIHYSFHPARHGRHMCMSANIQVAGPKHCCSGDALAQTIYSTRPLTLRTSARRTSLNIRTPSHPKTKTQVAAIHMRF